MNNQHDFLRNLLKSNQLCFTTLFATIPVNFTAHCREIYFTNIFKKKNDEHSMT